MLRGLHIRNMLLIDRLDLDFQPGLNVLTGETGAGKSILLDSLGFVLGWRGRADLVRSGADQGEVTAVFDIPDGHPVKAVLAEQDLALEDGELILRRTNTPSGRKTAFVNDRRVSGEALRSLSDKLVELHGQHDDRGLLNTRGHRALLDAFAGVNLGPIQTAWAQLRTAQTALDKARADLKLAQADEEYLRHAVNELDTLAPQSGEEATLDTQRRMMQGAERIRGDIAKAANALGGDAAEGAMTDALRWLEGAADHAEGQLEPVVAAVSRALSELADAQRGVEDCLNALDFNPLELENTEERLFAIRALARKHSVVPDALAGFADDLRERLSAIDGGADQIGSLEGVVQSAKAQYDSLAEKLSEQRRKFAARLDKAMLAELTPLKMERAVFTTEITTAEAGREGRDQVAFTVATNPGAPSGPIDKIASGGELSRFLLALKVCLTKRSEGVTLIFDEIDRGVGGATADAVGRRLAALANSAQILVVTHSPQVAAQGAHQWQVSKSVAKGETRSTVAKLDVDERTREIARMLAGDVITPEAEAAARTLLTRRS
ncbi:DNA repair protein RecN [Roseobacter sp. N2S]|uniref:DNA repair protein RecN n=1 Tax=Roseobacter sp. N2S TaxID=2663844 RepID=UPI00285F78F6|nr:DNA repair protein RecN [Roseobacter sp. N2S]MDR6264754.1 DNA repair protein RecN (Recombination protein N) [Roseobacter sp. N2S]